MTVGPGLGLDGIAPYELPQQVDMIMHGSGWGAEMAGFQTPPCPCSSPDYFTNKWARYDGLSPEWMINAWIGCCDRNEQLVIDK